MEQILKSISSFLWGAPVLILLAAVGLLFGCKTKFFQFRKFGYILKNTAGEMFKKGGGAKGKEGTLTPLQAVMGHTKRNWGTLKEAVLSAIKRYLNRNNWTQNRISMHSGPPHS